MTQSTPTEAWLKEAAAKAEQFWNDSPLLKQCKTEAWDFRQWVVDIHLAGQQCERERSAPDEQEWEKLKVEGARKAVEENVDRIRHLPLNSASEMYQEGFDAAVNLIARPLKAELTKARELNLSGLRALNERDSARAEVASLRAENEKLKQSVEKFASRSGIFKGEAEALRERVKQLEGALRDIATYPNVKDAEACQSLMDYAREALGGGEGKK